MLFTRFARKSTRQSQECSKKFFHKRAKSVKKVPADDWPEAMRAEPSGTFWQTC